MDQISKCAANCDADYATNSAAYFAPDRTIDFSINCGANCGANCAADCAANCAAKCASIAPTTTPPTTPPAAPQLQCRNLSALMPGWESGSVAWARRKSSPFGAL